MGRRDARIARKNIKQLKEKEKKARLVETVLSDSLPRMPEAPDNSKEPRAAETPDSIMQMPMTFSMFGHADRDGAWSWGQERNWCSPATRLAGLCTVFSTMTEMSKLTWAEIYSHTTGIKERHKKHHSQSWDSLCLEAQERWVEINRTEEELFRFRTGAKSRIWGFRQASKFYVVWWDSEHKIYPTEKG